ncbi:MAG: hypothetical protein ACM3YM_04940 [Sphingomonadales bacterium]
MPKSATEVMQDILFSAVIDSIVALKAASKGLPNTLLREINAVHANTTFGDLPRPLQDCIGASVRSAFTRLLREGYSVSGAQAGPQRQTGPGQAAGDRRRPAGKPPAGRGPGGERKPSGRDKPRNRKPRPPQR